MSLRFVCSDEPSAVRTLVGNCQCCWSSTLHLKMTFLQVNAHIRKKQTRNPHRVRMPHDAFISPMWCGYLAGLKSGVLRLCPKHVSDIRTAAGVLGLIVTPCGKYQTGINVTLFCIGTCRAHISTEPRSQFENMDIIGLQSTLEAENLNFVRGLSRKVICIYNVSTQLPHCLLSRIILFLGWSISKITTVPYTHCQPMVIVSMEITSTLR